MMTVSTKVAHSWLTGFQISKTIRCFWCTCIFIALHDQTYISL